MGLDWLGFISPPIGIFEMLFDNPLDTANNQNGGQQSNLFKPVTIWDDLKLIAIVGVILIITIFVIWLLWKLFKPMAKAGAETVIKLAPMAAMAV